jgi:RNA polymerase sigma factor (sigma-70 family)
VSEFSRSLLRSEDFRLQNCAILCNALQTIARDYVDFGLPLLDLISEGNIGLMEAVGRFDPGKGSKLSTYASWWIKWAIKRALVNQSKTIRLPAQVVDRITRMRFNKHLGPVESEVFRRSMTDDLDAYEPLTMGIRCMDLSCFRKDQA